MRQGACRISPSTDEAICVVRCSQARFEFSGCVIVKAEVCRRETLFQYRHACEQADGFAFHFIGRNQKHFALAFKKGAGDPAEDILRKSNGTVFERDVNRRPIQRRVPDLIDAGRI